LEKKGKKGNNNKGKKLARLIRGRKEKAR